MDWGWKMDESEQTFSLWKAGVPESIRSEKYWSLIAYQKALQLEPDNASIKQNYDLFKEINDRTSRDNGR